MIFARDTDKSENDNAKVVSASKTPARRDESRGIVIRTEPESLHCLAVFSCFCMEKKNVDTFWEAT